MTVRITLKDTLTGKTAEYLDEYSTEDRYEDSFMWNDGNFGCDCNRNICFYGEVKDDIRCGDGRFLVVGWERLK